MGDHGDNVQDGGGGGDGEWGVGGGEVGLEIGKTEISKPLR